MRKSDLRDKAIRRIKRFAITEEELDDLIHVGEYYYEAEREEGEPYATIKCMIEQLSEQKRHDLMCLMFLGRNIDYYGLCEETIDDFCVYADEKANSNGYGREAPDYLAGKKPIAKWLRLVKKEIRPDFWYIGTRFDGNITLREIIPEDVSFMMRLVTDPRVTRFIPGMIQEREMLSSWIQSLGAEDHEYIVRIEETDEMIGECSLTEHGECGEIGFMLLPQYWQRGYGTEVVHCLVENARGRSIKELTATTDANNTAAIRLLEKTGFKKQKNGWMVIIPEEENRTIERGQNIIQFQRSL